MVSGTSTLSVPFLLDQSQNPIAQCNHSSLLSFRSWRKDGFITHGKGVRHGYEIGLGERLKIRLDVQHDRASIFDVLLQLGIWLMRLHSGLCVISALVGGMSLSLGVCFFVCLYLLVVIFVCSAATDIGV